MDMIGAVGRLQDSLSRRKTRQNESERPAHKKPEAAARQPNAAPPRPPADSGTQIGNLVDTSA
jgi:hypothetical protein